MLAQSRLCISAFALFLIATLSWGCKAQNESDSGADPEKSATTPTLPETLDERSEASPQVPACALPRESIQLIDVNAEQLLEHVREPGANAVIVNLWATWCAPCVEEFPAFVDFHRQHCEQGLRTIFVSADFKKERDKAINFLKKQGVSATTMFKIGDENAFISTLHSEWSGALPATFVYDSSGNLVHFVDGSVTPEAIAAMVNPLLDAPTPNEKKQ